MIKMITPQWSIPTNVKAASTTRHGGCSLMPFASLNLGTHVGDDLETVVENRRQLTEALALPRAPFWLNQVHGTDVVALSAKHEPTHNSYDAAYTNEAGQVCVVMTADCLPILFCSAQGDEVAVAHAGWRSLCYGVIENTLKHFKAPREEIAVWLGPAIGPAKFEVGAEVRTAFIQQAAQAESAFLPYGEKYLANIYQLARQRLAAEGVLNVSGGEYCTVTDENRFFSYRRDGQTGRMATLIWFS